jgi:hypothetical protein
MKSTDSKDLDELHHRDDFARFRDPLSAKVGYHCSDLEGCVCHSKWFDSVGDLVNHILEVELPLDTFGDEDEQEKYFGPLQQLLAGVKHDGLTEELRNSINNLYWGGWVHWWGKFDDLLTGETPFSREMLGRFAAKHGDLSGDVRADIRPFVEFLSCCCKSQ